MLAVHVSNVSGAHTQNILRGSGRGFQELSVNIGELKTHVQLSIIPPVHLALRGGERDECVLRRVCERGIQLLSCRTREDGEVEKIRGDEEI